MHLLYALAILAIWLLLSPRTFIVLLVAAISIRLIVPRVWPHRTQRPGDDT